MILERERFRSNVTWNLASLVVLGAAGVCLNLIIGRYRSPETLGLFNELFAIFIILSQLCAFGVHLSVLSYVSRSSDDSGQCLDILNAALALVLAISLVVVTFVAWVGLPLIDEVFGHREAKLGAKFVLPGVVLFALNKVLLNYLNGLGKMRVFAVFHMARFGFLLAGVALCIALRGADAYLGLGLTAAEALLFGGLSTHLLCTRWRVCWGASRCWLRPHLRFGSRGMLGGLFSGMNTRVDVLMLGWLMGESSVGLYSMAALVAEGLGQIPYAVRRNIDPLFGKAWAESKLSEFGVWARNVKWKVYAGMFFVVAFSIAIYPVGLWVFIPDEAYKESIPVFVVLAIGVLIQSGYRSFFGLFFQAGYPGLQSSIVVVATLLNIVLNYVLIQGWGILGAGMATASVMVVEAVLIHCLCRVVLNLRL